MKRLVVLLLVVMLGWIRVGGAQELGQIFGTVTDSTGAVLPGVTVTVTGVRLLQPRVAVSSATGTYQLPGLTTGDYSVTFELPGFTTVIREEIQIDIGFNAQINAQLDVAAVAETVVVTGVSPVLDIRSTASRVTYSSEILNALPTTRDVYNVYQQAPALVINITNVGGNTGGNQASFISRGATIQQNRTWKDGVETGTGGTASPFYLDYDAVEEMQITTGGGDVTMQTPGGVISIVTKSGADLFHGSAQGFWSGKGLTSRTNVDDALRQAGASAGILLLNFKDFGAELGGPIVRDRAWFWGSTGRQLIETGVRGFFLPTPECAAIAADELAFPVNEVKKCLNIHNAALSHINYTISVRPFRNNTFSLRNGYDLKFEDLRGANDLVPPSATSILGSATSAKGPRFWSSGWPLLWRFNDQHIVNDRWVVEGGFGRYCQCLFIGAPEELRLIQPALETSTGERDRSAGFTIDWTLIRNTVDFDTTYFLPGVWGGDHSLKTGFKYLFYSEDRSDIRPAAVESHFNSGALPAFSTALAARFHRSRELVQNFTQQSAWIQDTYARDRLTLKLGLRWDRQTDRQGISTAAASPFSGDLDINGAAFNFLPALSFAGVEGAQVPVWTTVAPRVGATYDLTDDGKTLIKGSFAVYYEQRALGGGGHVLSNTLNTIGRHRIDFPWTDLNGDKLVQVNEVDTSTILSFAGGYDPADPAGLNAVSNNQINPDMKVPVTREAIVGVSRELAANFGVSVSYIYRKGTDFVWKQRLGITSADYSPVTFTPAAADCPSGARCETVTYFVPNFSLGAPTIFTNQTDYSRSYNGLEVVATKRLSQGWMLNGSVAYNNSREFYGSDSAFQDPTNITQRDGAQYAPGVAGGGLLRPNMNAKWIARLSGLYRLPWQGIGVSGTLDARQGYPRLQSVRIATRPNRAGGIDVLLDRLGDVRSPTFRFVSVRVSKQIELGQGVEVEPTFDIFNVFNANTLLAQRERQNASNANRVANILAPLVYRIGATIKF